MIQLGFDLSTTTCGFAFTKNSNIIDLGYIDISKLETYKEKALFIFKEIDDKKIKFDSINIEAALGGWSGGGGTMQTVIKLARWNAVFEYICNEYYKMPVNLCNSLTMRKQILGKSFCKGMKAKDFVKQEIEKKFDLSKWTVLNKKGVEDKRMADVRDALICSLFKSN